MNSLRSLFSRAKHFITNRSTRTWAWYRARARWQQVGIALLIIAILIALIAALHHSSADEEQAQERTVSIESVGELSGNGTGTSIVGTVRSVTQADLLAQSGGIVRSVHTTLGARVPAGFVIADLDNASQAAAVLQAQGGYDAAIAARNITGLQSGNTQTSFAEAQRDARTTYRSAFSALETALDTQVDTFFGEPTATGPRLLINQGPSNDLGRKRQALDARIDAWRRNLASADTQDPSALLIQATNDAQAISDFLVELSQAANERDSRATPEQLTALAAARATVNAQLAALSAARDAYNGKKTAASVAGSARSESGTQLAAANANILSALGSLRSAQAAYEKTRVRATIGGTVNYLPIKVGQYVNALERVATVANNGALEIVAYVPEEEREALSVGMSVQVEGSHAGTVTEISPALNPTTKQIEVHVAVDATPDLVNGQSVRIALPSETAQVGAGTAQAATSTASANVPVLLPLAAVKLLPDSRAVFTVDSDGRLVAHNVTIGDVSGDRIQVLSGLTSDMQIVSDARGLSEGQKVSIASSTATQ